MDGNRSVRRRNAACSRTSMTKPHPSRVNLAGANRRTRGWLGRWPERKPSARRRRKERPKNAAMSEFMSHYAVPAAIIAVAIVLVLGLDQYDARRLAQPLATADAAARAAAIRRHHRHHGDDLGDGALAGRPGGADQLAERIYSTFSFVSSLPPASFSRRLEASVAATCVKAAWPSRHGQDIGGGVALAGAAAEPNQQRGGQQTNRQEIAWSPPVFIGQNPIR